MNWEADYEYKRVAIEHNSESFAGPRQPNIEAVLNDHADDGWHLHTAIGDGQGHWSEVILEREVNAR